MKSGGVFFQKNYYIPVKGKNPSIDVRIFSKAYLIKYGQMCFIKNS